MDIFFTTRKIAKSAILEFDGVDDKGRRYVIVVFHEGTDPFTSEIADGICLYDGTWSTLLQER
jgi:hypothetical protein